MWIFSALGCVFLISVPYNYEVLSQTVPDVPEQIENKGAVGLVDSFEVKQCITSTDCSFLFICPERSRPFHTLCLLPQQNCPNITTLTYSLEPFHRIMDLPDLEEEIEDKDEKTRTCRYDIGDFLGRGLKVGHFGLDFDRSRGELSLRTSAEVDRRYIKCYAGRRKLGMRRIEFPEKTKENLTHYNLDITDEPHECYCYVDAPMIFQPIMTERVIAYSRTPFNRYILKTSRNQKPSTILNIIKAKPFQQCKMMLVDGDSSYYFFRDPTSLTLDEVTNIVKRVIQWTSALNSSTYLRNIDYCEAGTTTSTFNQTLHWDRSLTGTVNTPRELCLDESAMQVTRYCAGDFLNGALWLDPSGNCSRAIKLSQKTGRLYHHLNEEFPESFPNISAETEEFTKLSPVDLNLLSHALIDVTKVQDGQKFQDEFFVSVENAMKVNSSLLKISQRKLNSTDRILDAIDEYTTQLSRQTQNISVTTQSNLIIQVSCPFVSEITGLAIYREGVSDNFSNYRIVGIHRNESFDDLELKGLELATYVPKDLIGDLTWNLSTGELEEFKIITTVFYADVLFNEIEEAKGPTGSRIVNVKMTGFEGNFNGTIPLLFRQILKSEETDCAYWDYGRQRYGRWSTGGGQNLDNFGSDTLMQCSFNHLTHFALLVLSEDYIVVEEYNGEVIRKENTLMIHDLALTVITLIGCSLSVFGILVIILTTLLIKDWYKPRLNSIQLSLVMILEILMLFIADMKVLDSMEKGAACSVIAASLHYIVLAKFTWMFLISRIQYLRFVKVFDSTPSTHSLIVHSLIGWAAPAIPVLLSYFIFPHNYRSGESNFCYAKGYTLYFLLILPVGIIIFLNVIVFASIMVNISKSKSKNRGALRKLQVRLAVMLLFMLGITWVFGVIGEFVPVSWIKFACLYVFCILASVQGFVVFVFNVLLDEETLHFWMDSLCCRSKSKKNAFEKSANNEMMFISNRGGYFGKRQ